MVRKEAVVKGSLTIPSLFQNKNKNAKTTEIAWLVCTLGHEYHLVKMPFLFRLTIVHSLSSISNSCDVLLSDNVK